MHGRCESSIYPRIVKPYAFISSLQPAAIPSASLILCILVGDVPFDGWDKPVEKLWKFMEKVSSREVVEAERYVVSLFQFSHFTSCQSMLIASIRIP